MSHELVSKFNGNGWNDNHFEASGEQCKQLTRETRSCRTVLYDVRSKTFQANVVSVFISFRCRKYPWLQQVLISAFTQLVTYFSFHSLYLLFKEGLKIDLVYYLSEKLLFYKKKY